MRCSPLSWILQTAMVNEAVMAFVSVTVHGQPSPSTKPAWEIYAQGTLVKAEVVAITEEKKDALEFSDTVKVRIALKITHVYCGNGVRTGGEFVAFSYPHGSGTADDIHPLPRIGEAGLWIVQVSKVGAFAHGYVDFLDHRFNLADFRFPSRNGISPRYTQCEALADAAEAVWRADRKTGIELLSKYLCSETPEISAWAVCALLDADPDGLQKIAGDIDAIKKVPLAGQVELDVGLSVLVKEWPLSGRA